MLEVKNKNKKELLKFFLPYLKKNFNVNIRERFEIFYKKYLHGKTIEDYKQILFNKIKEKYNIEKNYNNCPIKRRPIDNKCNNELPFMKKNPKGFLCCYKKK
jgi:hypothetical protein